MKLQPPGVPVDSHAVYSKDTGLASSTDSLSQLLFQLSPSLSFSLRLFASLILLLVLSNARTQDKRHSFQLVLVAALAKSSPLIFDGGWPSTLHGVSNRRLLVIQGEYSPSFNEITCTITIKDRRCAIPCSIALLSLQMRGIRIQQPPAISLCRQFGAQ